MNIIRDKIYVRVEPDQIDMLSKLVEGFEGLGIVSTLNRQEGLVLIRVTPDTYDDMVMVLQNLPFPVQTVNKSEV